MRSVMDSIKGICAIVLALTCVAMSPTLAIQLPRSPWLSPCSVGRRVANTQLVNFHLGSPDPEASIPHYMHEMRIAMRRARENAHRIYQHILTNRLPTLLQEDCMYGQPLEGMPVSESHHDDASNPYSALPEDFRRLAVLTVFLQETTNDEITYHHRLHLLERRLVRMMCFVESVSLTMGQTFQRDVTHSVMPTQYTNLPDEAQRDRRNCLIARDTFNMLDAIDRWYWPSASRSGSL